MKIPLRPWIGRALFSIVGLLLVILLSQIPAYAATGDTSSSNQLTNKAQAQMNTGDTVALNFYRERANQDYKVNISASSEITSTLVTYLPLVINPHPPRGIHGTVTSDGDPLPDIQLRLEFYDGANTSTIATGVTDADGEYSFMGIPGLNPGQAYYVLYENPGYPQWLWIWRTRKITSYEVGSNVNIGDFDLAEVYLSEPMPLRTVHIPVTFSWERRAATPTDSYELDIYDPYFRETYFYTDPPLGYVSSYTLTYLPAGFKPDYLYVWEVWIYSPDGGFGISYEFREIKFASGNLNAMPDDMAVPTRDVLHRGEIIRR